MTKKKEYKNISTALTEAIENLKDGYKGSSLTDLYLVVDKDSNELSIYDDEQNILSQVIIESWDSTEDKDIVSHLRKIVQEFDFANKFDELDIYKPFSVSITDEDFVIQEELLVIEEESIIRIEKDFLDRIDKEFDEFLERLLKE